jgi:hypothetical protein
MDGPGRRALRAIATDFGWTGSLALIRVDLVDVGLEDRIVSTVSLLGEAVR